MFYYIPIIIAAIANVFYHIYQKSIPQKINSLASLIITYFTAGFFCLILLPFFGKGLKISRLYQEINIYSILVGVSIIGLELGYLLAYRKGWDMSIAVLVANTVVSIILIPAGIFLFKESFSLIKLGGIFFCIIGLIMINK